MQLQRPWTPRNATSRDKDDGRNRNDNRNQGNKDDKDDKDNSDDKNQREESNRQETKAESKDNDKNASKEDKSSDENTNDDGGNNNDSHHRRSYEAAQKSDGGGGGGGGRNNDDEPATTPTPTPSGVTSTNPNVNVGTTTGGDDVELVVQSNPDVIANTSAKGGFAFAKSNGVTAISGPDGAKIIQSGTTETVTVPGTTTPTEPPSDGGDNNAPDFAS